MRHSSWSGYAASSRSGHVLAIRAMMPLRRKISVEMRVAWSDVQIPSSASLRLVPRVLIANDSFELLRWDVWASDKS